MSDRVRNLKTDVLRAGLSALYHTGAHTLLAPYACGLGLIFMLHHVRPARPRDFAPNRILEVTPEFLQAVIDQVRDAGLDIVDLDEARTRILQGGGEQRFACFTLDDGYRDNLEYAYPLFKANDAPFTIYVPSDYPDGKGELWWLALEEVFAKEDRLEIRREQGAETVSIPTLSDKSLAYDDIYWWLRRIPEDQQRSFMRELCDGYDVDMAALSRDLLMTWDEIKTLDGDPLCTIGAHTVAHYAVAKLDDARARREMAEGAERLAEKLGHRPRHLSYPYGDATSAARRDFEIAQELGFATAVTTRKGLVFAEHKAHLTALPRVSLNGDYQSLKFTELYLSGAPSRFGTASANLMWGEGPVVAYSGSGRCIQRTRTPAGITHKRPATRK